MLTDAADYSPMTLWNPAVKSKRPKENSVFREDGSGLPKSDFSNVQSLLETLGIQ